LSGFVSGKMQISRLWAERVAYIFSAKLFLKTMKTSYLKIKYLGKRIKMCIVGAGMCRYF